MNSQQINKQHGEAILDAAEFYRSRKIPLHELVSTLRANFDTLLSLPSATVVRFNSAWLALEEVNALNLSNAGLPWPEEHKDLVDKKLAEIEYLVREAILPSCE